VALLQGLQQYSATGALRAWALLLLLLLLLPLRVQSDVPAQP